MRQRAFPGAKIFWAAAALAWCNGCAELQHMQTALQNLQRLLFKLDHVAAGALAGVDKEFRN